MISQHWVSYVLAWDSDKSLSESKMYQFAFQDHKHLTREHKPIPAAPVTNVDEQGQANTFTIKYGMKLFIHFQTSTVKFQNGLVMD